MKSARTGTARTWGAGNVVAYSTGACYGNPRLNGAPAGRVSGASYVPCREEHGRPRYHLNAILSLVPALGRRDEFMGIRLPRRRTNDGRQCSSLDVVLSGAKVGASRLSVRMDTKIPLARGLAPVRKYTARVAYRGVRELDKRVPWPRGPRSCRTYIHQMQLGICQFVYGSHTSLLRDRALRVS